MPVALLSVSDKTGLIDFARALNQLGWELLASGGTASAIRNAGLPVRDVADYTHSPEILGGRVKTLHPAVHGGILARDLTADMDDLRRINAVMIDMVVVNLYPFQKTVADPNATLADAIENIDIGGVALIRAAAKNSKRVAIVTDPASYDAIADELRLSGSLSAGTLNALAVKGFKHTAAYDTAIAAYLDMAVSQQEIK